jgi:hypothetical protein
VLESIFAAMERCKKADNFNATGVFKGAELLGKHLGMAAWLGLLGVPLQLRKRQLAGGGASPPGT